MKKIKKILSKKGEKKSPGRKLFFQIARIVAILFLGLIVAGVIALTSLDIEKHRDQILNIVRTETGLPVEIDGKISWKFSLRPHIVLNSVRVPNAEWATAPDGFVAEQVNVVVNPLSLLFDGPIIQELKIYKSVVNLEINDDGVYSIRPIIESATTNEPDHINKYPIQTNFGISAVELDDVKINVNDTHYVFAGLYIEYVRHIDNVQYTGWMRHTDASYPFDITLSPYNSERKIYPVHITLASDDQALDINVALEGTSKMPIDFIIRGVVPDMVAVGNFFGVSLPDDFNGIELNIAGGFENHTKLNLHKSSVALRGANLDIQGSYDWSKNIPNITAVIKSANINLPQVFPEMYGDGNWTPPKHRPLHVFKDMPLHGEIFTKINIDLDLSVENMIVYRELVLKNTALKFNIKDSKGRADIQASFMGGDIVAGANLDIDPDGTVHAIVAGKGANVSVGNIIHGVHENNFISDLPVNFLAYWRASGHSMSGLMASLTGPAKVWSVAGGKAHSDLVEYMYGQDFLTELRHSLHDMAAPEKKYDNMTIDCVAANVKVRKGRVETDRGIAIQTNAINVRMVGNVDLGTENIRVSMITTPTRGLKLSLTSGVADTMQFVGNMAEPKLEVSGGAVVGKVATAAGVGLLLAPFTGGMSVLAGAGVGYFAGDVIENWLADSEPCQTAMKSGAPSIDGDAKWMSRPVTDLVNEVLAQNKSE